MGEPAITQLTVQKIVSELNIAKDRLENIHGQREELIKRKYIALLGTRTATRAGAEEHEKAWQGIEGICSGIGFVA